MDATWHARPCGSATRAHAAPTRRCDTLFIFTYILVIVHIVFRLSEENYEPSKPSHNINPIPYFNFLRVGLSSTEFIVDAGDVAKSEALDHN